MTAIAKALARTFPSISSADDQLITIAIFCGVGLLASLVFVAGFGIDLSATDLF